MYPRDNAVSLSNDTAFLNHIFNNGALNFLKISSEVLGVNQVALYAPVSVLTFISYFTWAFLTLLENNTNKSACLG
jgi:hypothetical protein